MKRIIFGTLVPVFLYASVRYGLTFLAPGVLPGLEVMIISSVALAMVISSLLHVGASYKLATGFNLACLAIVAHALLFYPAIWQGTILLGGILLCLLYSLTFLVHYFVIGFSQFEKKNLLMLSGLMLVLSFASLITSHYLLF